MCQGARRSSSYFYHRREPVLSIYRQREIRSNNRYCPISQKSIQLGNQASEMQYTQMFFDSVVTMTNSTPILNPSEVVDFLNDTFAVV